MDFPSLSEPVTAAMIGALATAAGALVQLRISWRREMKERERGQPITKKTRRGPVIVVFALLAAAAVGGFALSQYFVSLREGDRDALRADLQSKLSEINATAMRLEQARTNERKQIETEVQRADASHLGEEGAAASVVVGPCSQIVPGTRLECTEQSALKITICARVPASATVKEVQLYIGAEKPKQPWQENRVQPGEEAGDSRFLSRLYPVLLPRLLGLLGADVELHFLDGRRRRHSCADRDLERALLGALQPRPGDYLRAGTDHDARRRAFLAQMRGIRALDLGFDLLALVRPRLLQAHRGRVDLRELRLEIGAQGIAVAFAQGHEVLRKREPAHRRSDQQSEDDDHGPASGFLRDRLTALALLHFPAPGNAQLNERARHRGKRPDQCGGQRFGKARKIHGRMIRDRVREENGASGSDVKFV